MAGDELQPITAIARKIGIPETDLETFGRYSAKVSLGRLPAAGAPPKGKLILVTGITPTSAGEGKTVTTIGLAQGLERLGKKAIATLREPSLGPVFGVKGGATGGGKSQVLPAEKINLHFNGDKHAVTAAHLPSGTGYIVAVAGNMLLMPGLPKVPQAVKMHVTSNGTISGVS
jgi:formate--tetrahydrofolate ligase